MDKKVLKFELSPQSLKIKNVLKNDFIAIDVYAISDVYPNRNNSYFPVSAMQDAKPTFYNKPALGAFDVAHDDFKAHEMEYRWDNELQQDYFDFTNGKCEVPLGVIRGEDLVEIVEHDGQTWVHFTCVLWAKYAYKQVKRLLKDTKKKISVEIEVLESHIDENKVEVIDKFIFDGFTILGSAVTEAIPNAHLTILDKINDAVYQKQEKCLSFAYKELEDNNNKDKNSGSDTDNKNEDFDSTIPDNGVVNEKVDEITMDNEQRGEEPKTMTYEEKRQLLESFLNSGLDENASHYSVTEINDNVVCFSLDDENFKATYSINEENVANVDMDSKEKIVLSKDENPEDESGKETESKECESEDGKCEVCGNNPCTCAHEDDDGNKDDGHKENESKDDKNDDDHDHDDDNDDNDDDDGKKETEAEDNDGEKKVENCEDPAQFAATDVTVDESHADHGQIEGEELGSPKVDTDILKEHDDGSILIGQPSGESNVIQDTHYAVGDEQLTADELYERFNTLNASFAELAEKYNALNAQFNAKKNAELYALACSLVDSEEDLTEENATNIKAFMKENCDNSTYASDEELNEAVDHKIADALYAQKKLSRKAKEKEFSADIVKDKPVVTEVNDSANNLKNAMKNLNKI